ncbi:MAG: CoB--CoM heterodisulfide reductase iron-sulfur subunit A family protein [Dehalococcoidia bacterium]|nr:CoB--CoM heterodisulfide reductase iron-sulfur subunit A family protein [Dehalococcoidia bacterium]
MNNKGQNTPVLVIGAGIAGIEASLLLANSGRKVYLVEKTSYIGGNVIKFEEVFPNMDCATCMIAPKQQELLANENVVLLRLSEVEAVNGSSGDFTVKVRRKAGYVDLENCIGCSACFDPCPVEVDNEFEERLSKRKAIYIPCAGALPNVPVIDTENCLRFKGQDCGACHEACMFEAIDFAQQDEELELKVGAIIVATGFQSFDPGKITQYGYKKLGDVYSAMEVERICASNGPTEGQILTKSGQPPESVAIIHCVGREEKGYCSSICCMASLKLSHFIKKKLPQVKITQFYSDLCIPGKAYQTFYEEVKESGVDFIRGTVTEVSQSGKGLTIKYRTEDGKENTLTAGMVILNPAVEPTADSPRLAEILNIPQSKEGFFGEKEPDLTTVATAQEGVFIAGCAQSPKDIAETVAEAEATAGRILSLSR